MHLPNILLGVLALVGNCVAVIANFDDIPTNLLEQAINEYKGLNYPNWFVGSNDLNINGVTSNTPPRRAVHDIKNGLTTVGTITITSGYESFHLRGLAYACAPINVQGQVGLGVPCKITLEAYADTAGKRAIGERNLTYDAPPTPNSILTTDMQTVNFGESFPVARRVDFRVVQPVLVGALLYGILIDTLDYKLIK